MPASHAAIVDIDTGSRDLQQCADSVIRLRAEYLFSRGRFDAVSFKFTSGDPARYADWRAGLRPEISGSRVEWKKKTAPNPSYHSFRAYLDVVFTYAGTLSLERELRSVPRVSDLRAGDIFIQGGSPGHAVIVADVAENPSTSARAFVLVQGFMPAQDIHIVRNQSTGTPWYPASFGETLSTPHWAFAAKSLRRFGD
ncbi:MAG: DUF4846 domain-containing protein [Planctomycetota bacterium]